MAEMPYTLVDDMDSMVIRKIHLIPHDRGYRVTIVMPETNVHPIWWVDIGANDAE